MFAKVVVAAGWSGPLVGLNHTISTPESTDNEVLLMLWPPPHRLLVSADSTLLRVH